MRRGERIGQAQDDTDAHVYAPSAGRVASIEPRQLPHLAASATECVILETEPAATDPNPAGAIAFGLDCDARALQRCVRDACVVDRRGGAAALGAPGDPEPALLILDAVDSEPWLHCDAALLQERADGVIAGALLLQRALGAPRVVLALGSAMFEALDAARRAIQTVAPAIELIRVGSPHLAGDARRLVRRIAGVELAPGARPREHGFAVLDVATAVALHDAVLEGEPPLSRIVTIAGPGVVRPGNYRVAFGTPIAHLVAQAGGYSGPSTRRLVADAANGAALPHDDLPILACSRGVLVLDAAPSRDRAAESPCTDCGDCVPRCPQQLQPQRLLPLVQTGQFERARDAGVLDCIECGACDLACPSHIALASRFALARAELQAHDLRVEVAAAARTRFLARNARLAREQVERAALEAMRRDNAATSDAVQAALERARARRRGTRGDGS